MQTDQGIITGQTPEGYVEVFISDINIPSGIEVKDYLTTVEKNGRSKAIFAIIPESVFHRFLPQLLSLKYVFQSHGLYKQRPCFFYYRWIGPGEDCIKSVATSLDHIAALVVNAQDEVFMVKEFDKWRLPVICLKKGAGFFSQMEQQLEIFHGIRLDPARGVDYVGGWINEHGNHGEIHARMECYSVISLDGKSKNSLESVKQTIWINIMELKHEFKKALMDASNLSRKKGVPDTDVIYLNNQVFNKYHVAWIDRLSDDKVFPVSILPKEPQSNNNVYCIGDMSHVANI